jgi:hypothetical protein
MPGIVPATTSSPNQPIDGRWLATTHSSATGKKMSKSTESFYGPLRRSWELLNDEFRFASQKYPPIRYQYFFVPGELDWDSFQEFSDGTPDGEEMCLISVYESRYRPTRQSWEAFGVVNRTTCGSGWSLWEGPNDGRFFGCFFGDPHGWETFRSLAESAFVLLCENGGDYHRKDGYNGWMETICEIGQTSPTPLLREKGYRAEPFVQFEDRLACCVPELFVDKDGDSLSNPVCFELAHDVFLSSIAAIRRFVEPESVLLIGNQVEHLPTVEASSVSEEAGPEPELKDTAFRRFDFDGATWHIEFNRNSKSETGTFTTGIAGMAYLERLIKQPGKRLKAMEVEGTTGETYARYAEGEDDTEGTSTVQSFQEQINLQDIKKYKKEIARIEDELKVTANPERRVELEKQRDFIASFLRSNTGLFGRPRRLGPGTPEEQARKRVGNAITRSRKLIAKSMPKCGQHLEDCLGGENGRFVYRP